MAIDAVGHTKEKHNKGNGGYTDRVNSIEIPTYSAAVMNEFEYPLFDVTLTQDGVTHTPQILTAINPDEVNPPWNGGQHVRQHSNNYLIFRASGQVSVTAAMRVASTSGGSTTYPLVPISELRVVNRKVDLPATFSGTQCQFEIDGPGIYEVLVNAPVSSDPSAFCGEGAYVLHPNQTKYPGLLVPPPIDIQKETHKNPLFLIVLPPEENKPNKADFDYVIGEGTHDMHSILPSSNGRKIYIEAGLVTIGQDSAFVGGSVQRYAGGLSLRHNDEVYSELGAVIQGSLYTEQANPSNINIYGQCIVTHRGLTITDNERSVWSNHAIEMIGVGVGTNGTGNRIRGVTTIEAAKGGVTSYNQTQILETHIFSWIKRGDGYTVGNNSVTGDMFIKCQDDQQKMFYSNCYTSRNTIWQQNSGGPIKYSWHGRSSTKGNVNRNTVVTHSDVNTDHKVDEPDLSHMNSTSAAIGGLGAYEGSWFENHIVDDFVVREKHFLRFMCFRCISTNTFTDGSVIDFGEGQGQRGFNGVHVHNVTLEHGEPGLPSTFYGNQEGTVRNVKVFNLKHGSDVIQNRADLTSFYHSVGEYRETSAPGNVTNIWSNPPPVTNGWSRNNSTNVYTSAGDSTPLGYNINNDTTLPAGKYYRMVVNITGTNTVRLRTMGESGSPVEIGVYGSGTHNIIAHVPVRGLAFDDRSNAGMTIEVTQLVEVTVNETEHWTNPPPILNTSAWSHDGNGVYSKIAATWGQLGFDTQPTAAVVLPAGTYRLRAAVQGTMRALTRNNNDTADAQVGEFTDTTIDQDVTVLTRGLIFMLNNDSAVLSNISLTTLTSQDVVASAGNEGVVANIIFKPNALGE